MSPEPEGVAQVPSPRQKVEDDAEVPELSIVTGTYAPVPVNAPVTAAPAMVLFERVSVLEAVATVTPSTEITPADTRARVVSDAAPSSMVPVVRTAEVPAFTTLFASVRKVVAPLLPPVKRYWSVVPTSVVV